MSGEIEKNPTEYIHELEEKIRQLESREPKLERIVEITPADYESLKRENRKMEQQIRKYRQILSVGGVSELSLLIDQYIETSKKQLKKISGEINISNFDKIHIQQIIQLTDYINAVQHEFNAFISMHTEGKWVVHPIYRKLESDIRQINEMLSCKTNFYRIEESRLEEFHQTLLQMIEVIGSYFEAANEEQ